MSDYYDKDGNPLELMEWARLFEDPEYKIVKRDNVGDILVSTVWLGIDHNMLQAGPPIIFETMVFGGEHDQEMQRYTTLERAEKGHEVMVELVRFHDSSSG